MPRSLWSAFAADRIDHRALQQIIQRNFPSGSQPGLREVVYPGDGDHAVKLLFSKNDVLVGIEAGPSLTSAVEASIIEAINDALIDTGPRVIRQVRFADHKVTGSWRYKDVFQIAPPPEHAPQLNCVIGDHPFILEVKITESKDGFVTNQRASDAMRTAELLLAGLVNSSIHHLTARPMYGYWVRNPENNQTIYLQPFYHYTNGQFAADKFSPITTPTPVGFAGDLFGPYGMTAGTPITIPHELTEVLHLYYALPAATQEQFLRSCYWLRQANRFFLESFSAAFMAVITAAEALFDPPRETCAECKQPRYRLRSAFATLLDTYVPLAHVTSGGYGGKPSFQTRLKHLYDTRSQITHGSDLRGWDSGNGFTPLQSQDDNDLRTLIRIMPFALANWLQEQHQRTQDSRSAFC